MPRVQLSDEEMETMRSRLSVAAQDIYRRDGVEALTFRRLAEVVGISHTLPYRYFDNKDALLARMRLDALSHFEGYVREHEAQADAPLAKVRAVAEGYIQFALQRPDEYLLIFATHQPATENYPEVLEARRRVFDIAVEVVQHCIDRGILVGNALELAHHVWVSLHGLLMLHAAGQLVHGMQVDEIVEPLMQRLLASAATDNTAASSHTTPGGSDPAQNT